MSRLKWIGAHSDNRRGFMAGTVAATLTATAFGRVGTMDQMLRRNVPEPSLGLDKDAARTDWQHAARKTISGCYGPRVRFECSQSLSGLSDIPNDIQPGSRNGTGRFSVSATHHANL